MQKLSRDLLRYLDERSEWKTASMLSVHFGVSVRKIKYLIKELNETEPLILSSRKGYASNPAMKKKYRPWWSRKMRNQRHRRSVRAIF